MTKILCSFFSYFENGRRWRNRSLQKVNEDFDIEPDAKRANEGHIAKINCVLSSYFEAGRWLKVRSIQKVYEELEDESDAKRADETYLFPKVEIGKFYILRPIITCNIMLTSTNMIGYMTAMNRAIGSGHLINIQALLAI